MYTVINDFRGLSKPPAEAIKKREKFVRDIIQRLGDKYRLSKSMPRILEDKK
jgi:hypothetical protein